jgi:hypothetical protein
VALPQQLTNHKRPRDNRTIKTPANPLVQGAAGRDPVRMDVDKLIGELRYHGAAMDSPVHVLWQLSNA